jgi:hypothetical protein
MGRQVEQRPVIGLLAFADARRGAVAVPVLAHAAVEHAVAVRIAEEGQHAPFQQRMQQ